MDQRTLTTLFESAERGDAAASEALFSALYTELHRMARRELGRRGGQVTLSATTLLHEAYIKMSDRDDVAFPDRPRFLAYAARVMRRLIIDHVRRRHARKRGGHFERTQPARLGPLLRDGAHHRGGRDHRRLRSEILLHRLAAARRDSTRGR